VQSALLEVMQERQVTIGRESHKVPEPFLVLATQNPIETEGTYALPEAQVDRFMLKVLVGYPSDREEMVIVQRMTGVLAETRQILTTGQLLALQQQADQVYVDPELMEYAVRLVGATRRPDEHGLTDIARYLSFGASPRASINLILAARALALTRGRDYVVPGDIAELAPDVLRHRIVLSYEALADRVSADDLIDRVLEMVPRPARPFTDDPRLTTAGSTNGEGV
jgi:MoxR-like ATPase